MRFLTTNFAFESQTTITPSTEASSFPASNLKNPLRSKRWRSTDVNDQTIVIDLQTTEDINSIILLWPKEDDIKLTGSVTLTIQANATNVWTSPAVSQSLTINDDYSVASHFFSSNQSYRYWRLLIDDPTNPYGYLELGMIWLGGSLSIDNAQKGFDWSVVDQTQVNENDFGHKYFNEFPLKTLLTVGYENLTYDQIQILENAYRTNGNHKPVIMALDPEEQVFDKDHYLIYGTMSSKISTKHINYNILSMPGMLIEEMS